MTPGDVDALLSRIGVQVGRVVVGRLTSQQVDALLTRIYARVRAVVGPVAAQGAAVGSLLWAGSATGSTPASGSIAHGSQLPATSLAAASVIGPQGTLTPMSGGTLKDGDVLEDAEVGMVSVASGAHVVFRNCRIVGSLGQTTYTIKHTAGGGATLELIDCEVIARTTSSSSPRCIAMFGDASFKATRTIFRGGIDAMYFNPPGSPGAFTSSDSLVPNPRVHLVECWLGDIQRVASSHSDGCQVDGGGYLLMERCRSMGYSLPVGSDPLTTRVSDPATADLCSGVFICTQNSSNLSLISRVALRDSWFEGGNNTVDTAPPELAPVDCAVSGCEFGIRFNFRPLRAGSGTAVSNNTWGQSGTVTIGGDTIQAVAGQPLP